MATTTTTAPLDELVWLRIALEDGTAERILRRARVSASEAARDAGVDPSAVSHWRALRRRPRGAEGLRFAKTLRRLEQGARQ